MNSIEEFCSALEAALLDIPEVKSVIIFSGAKEVRVRVRLLLDGGDYEIEQKFSNMEIELTYEPSALIERLVAIIEKTAADKPHYRS